MISDCDFDSKIINGDDERIQFYSLCNFEIGQSFKLLYRASRDGFDPKDFHSKCDNYPNTITIIQSMPGYIFGGYTQVCWTSTPYDKCCYDEKAFLFSLLNKFNKPFISKVVNPSDAIICNRKYGPRFGSSNNLRVLGRLNVAFLLVILT